MKALALLSLCLAFAGVAVARTTTDRIVAFTMSRTVNVSEGEAVTFKVVCPRGDVAVSAGLSRAALGAYQPKVRPIGSSAYEFGIALSPTNSDRKPTGTVACRSIRPGAARLRVRIVRTNVSVEPLSNLTVSLPCPAGTIPVGTGAAPMGIYLDVIQASPTPSRLLFVVKSYNEGDAERIVLFGSCIGLQPRHGQRLEVTRTTIHPLVRHGLHTYTKGCPRGTVSLGTGYLKAGPRVLAHAAMPWGGTWTAWVYRGDDPARARLLLICGRVVSS